MKIVEFGTHREVMITDDQHRVVVFREQPLTVAEFFTAYTAMTRSGAQSGSRRGPIATAADSPAPTAPRPRLLEPAKAQNVLDDPLLHHSGDRGIDRNVGIRLCRNPGNGDSLGQFTDYHDERRSLPRLCGATICGILLQPGSLDPSVTPSDASLRETARAASNYRRRQGIGGGDTGPEATELYIRIFRALRFTPQMLPSFAADRLVALYEAYLVCHAAA
jgi:hypothetical protein